MKSSSLNWTSLIGYEIESHAIEKLIEEESLPPILLFHGREGIAKSLFVAKVCSYLVCEQGKACGLCSSCVQLKNDCYPNLLFFDASTKQISGQEIKSIKDHLLTLGGQKSSTHKYKSSRLLFIKDVENLSTQSINKLLKIFEELPSHSYIFLSTSCRFSLLPTLRSRCVERLLMPPSREQSLDFLNSNHSGATEDILNKADKEKAKELLELSRGSIGLALKWLKDKSSSYKLIEIFTKQAFVDSYKKNHDLVDQIKKDKSYSLEDILLAKEIALNKVLKDSVLNEENSNQQKILSKKRRELKKIKDIVINKKIKLNKAFVLESLLLV